MSLPRIARRTIAPNVAKILELRQIVSSVIRPSSDEMQGKSWVSKLGFGVQKEAHDHPSWNPRWSWAATTLLALV